MRRSADRALLLLLMVLLGACEEDAVPKPRGYFRIDLPEARYRSWDPGCGYAAELPEHLVPKAVHTTDRTCWFDLEYPAMRATVHLTYQPVQGQLAELVEEAHDLKRTHELKATRIASTRVVRDSSRVYGTLFDVEGDVASPFVFYLTDSTTHFLYGALYFNARPNADSLAPVTEFLRKDLRRFATTLRLQ